uniref:DUF1640 domain-containing protein n=1 Tax=Candidatus Kentrum sp. LPFa TaxID=2126335 RepID=A0A450W647_9GAMM|nr:MAG: hypothetical protein BECKLPF1236B_GA0070989_103711 [Candidatus Kentron sp. LPFa]
MAITTFDTLRFVRILQESGISDIQAEAISRAFKDAQHESDFATKADIRELRSEIHALDRKIDDKITILDTKIDGKFSSLESKMNMVQWVLLLIVIAIIAPQLKSLF